MSLGPKLIWSTRFEPLDQVGPPLLGPATSSVGETPLYIEQLTHFHASGPATRFSPAHHPAGRSAQAIAGGDRKRGNRLHSQKIDVVRMDSDWLYATGICRSEK